MGKGYIAGAGAQGHILLELWQAVNLDWEFAFVDDTPALQGRKVSGVPVVGKVDFLDSVDWQCALAILAIGHNPRRLELAHRGDTSGYRWATLVHPSTVISPSADIGVGTVVLAQAVVSCQAQIGRHVIVNSGAIVEHNCLVEDGCALGPGVRMGGRVKIRQGAFVSTGATLVPRIEIGSGAVIGAGAVVIHDIPPNSLAVGVPARVIRQLDASFDWNSLL